MPTKTKKSNRTTLAKRRFTFTFPQLVLFVLVFATLGVYAIARSSANVASLPTCTITPSSPARGDSLQVKVQLPPVPTDSRDGKYWAKNLTPYNTAYSDKVSYDAATGTATYNWGAQTVKGKYGFYFTYMRKGDRPDYVEKRDIVRVSQTCSVNVP